MVESLRACHFEVCYPICGIDCGARAINYMIQNPELAFNFLLFVVFQIYTVKCEPAIYASVAALIRNMYMFSLKTRSSLGNRMQNCVD